MITGSLGRVEYFDYNSFLADDIRPLFSDLNDVQQEEFPENVDVFQFLCPENILHEKKRLMALCSTLRSYCSCLSKRFESTDVNGQWAQIQNWLVTGHALTSFQVGCAVLEDLLQQVVLREDPQQVKIRFKLSELLQTSSLHLRLGPSLSALLLSTIGPFCGFNARNIAFHGFITDLQRPLAGMFLYFMYSAFTELYSQKIPRKVIDCEAYEKNYSFLSLERSEIEKVVRNSHFIIPGTEKFWLEALHQTLDEGLIGLMRLFPLMEHALRRVFVVANGCDFFLFSASNSTLYTTLDFLLDHHYKTPPKLKELKLGELEEEALLKAELQRNQIFDVLGGPKNQLVNVMMDLFIWNDYRLRDLLAHGAVDMTKPCLKQSTHVAAVALGLCLRFCHAEDCGKLKHQIESYIANCGCSGHPESKVRDALKKASDLWAEHCEHVAVVEDSSFVNLALKFFDSASKGRKQDLVCPLFGPRSMLTFKEGMKVNPSAEDISMFKLIVHIAENCCAMIPILAGAETLILNQSSHRRKKKEKLEFFKTHGSGLSCILSGILEYCRLCVEDIVPEEGVLMNFCSISGSLLAILKQNSFKKAIFFGCAFLDAPDMFENTCLSKREVRNSVCKLKFK